ncbi:TonB-dependent receptor [Flaviaesturariibacter flavus]|uniref:TonB-dependent receptor n=1 Tax=Flaviaesturariibacter flavus TaxID=2502780 RepID=UPI001FB28381|nr:TonB-dependent receptor [Flaviaesturariibacter flavus]
MKGFVTCILALSCLGAAAQTEQHLTAFAAVNHTNETPEFSIQGRVLTTDGQPAPYATVQVRGTDKTTTTDETGTFVFRNLPEGSYTLVVSMTGTGAVERAIEVRKGSTTALEVRLALNEKQLTEVIVTSGRTLNDRTPAIGKAAIHPMDLPQAVTVLGAPVLREQQVQRLSDAIRNVNGVYMTTARGAVQESFAARGYAFGSSNLFKNGARLNSGAMPEMGSLERVEVLKGSAAILFGQVAPGGVVNLVTKQPKFSRGGEVSLRAGSYNLLKPAFDVYGPLSGKVAYRLNGSFESADSYRAGVHSDRYYINPSFLFKLGKRTELLLEGDYLKHDFTPDFGIGTIGAYGSVSGKTITPVARGAFFGTPWQYNITQQSTAGATLRHRISDNWNLQSALNYQFYSRDYMSVERVQADTAGNWGRSLGRIQTEEQYYTGQLNLNGKVHTGNWEHTILAGIDADHYGTEAYTFNFARRNFNGRLLAAGIYDSINLLNPGKYAAATDLPEYSKATRTFSPIDRFGIYAQDLVKLSDKFNVLLGARMSYVVTEGVQTTTLANDSLFIGTTRIDRAFSPRAGIVYKPTSNTSLFASYTNSFSVNTGIDVDNNPLKPSTINQYEVGVKNELFGGRLSANVTAYRIVNNNLAQTAPYLKDGVTPNNNSNIRMLSGQTISDGVELDLAASPIEGLDLRAGYSYNYMRYTKNDTTSGAFKTGERLVNNPAHTANASAFYTIGSGKLKGLKLGATFLYIGDRNAGWNSDVVKNTYTNSSVPKAPFSWRDRMFEVKGYSTLDLSAGYSWKRFALMAKVSNVTNTFNWYVHENYSVNPIPPRQLMGTLSYKF